jgi:hypothetical protein
MPEHVLDVEPVDHAIAVGRDLRRDDESRARSAAR